MFRLQQARISLCLYTTTNSVQSSHGSGSWLTLKWTPAKWWWASILGLNVENGFSAILCEAQFSGWWVPARVLMYYPIRVSQTIYSIHRETIPGGGEGSAQWSRECCTTVLLDPTLIALLWSLCSLSDVCFEGWVYLTLKSGGRGSDNQPPLMS
jgi:hypothetical protein